MTSTSKPKLPKPSEKKEFQSLSPATKLLEKRRKMYEINEAFEQ